MHFFPWMRSGHCRVQASPRGERYPASPSQQAKLCRGLGGAAAGPPLQRKPLPRVLCQARGRLLPAEAVRAAS